MTTTTWNMTAANLKAGDFLRRVRPISPRSAVFDKAIDMEVLDVTRFTDRGREYVSLWLGGPYSRRINVEPTREVQAATGAEAAMWAATLTAPEVG